MINSERKPKVTCKLHSEVIQSLQETKTLFYASTYDQAILELVKFYNDHRPAQGSRRELRTIHTPAIS